jgi:hypothetical protein
MKNAAVACFREIIHSLHVESEEMTSKYVM